MNITDKDLQKIIGAVLKYGVLTVLTIGNFWRSNLLIRASTRHGALFSF
jgi:hypothetical protein